MSLDYGKYVGKKHIMMVGLLCLLVVSFAVGSVSFHPDEPVLGALPATSGKSPSVPDSSLGASVDITYEILDKCTWTDREPTMFGSSDGWEIWTWQQANLLEDDNIYYTWFVYDTDSGTFIARHNFKIHSPYTDLKQVSYAAKYTETGGAFETDNLNIYIYTKDGRDTINFPDSDSGEDSGTQALNSSHVIDGYIHCTIEIDCQDNEAAVDQVTVNIDQLAFEYNDVTETRRSRYDVVGGTVRYAVDWTTWDYNVNTTLSVPNSWTFRDVNPDCEQTSDEFACLVPEDYEAIYTNGETAIANWSPHWHSSFEDGGDCWTSVSGSIETEESNYNYVMDGGVSSFTNNTSSVVHFTHDDTNTKRLADGTYYVVLSAYLASGSGAFQFRYYDGSWSWHTLTPTSGAWETFLFKITVAGVTGGRNWQIYLYSAPYGVYWDHLTFYESNVEVGETITGTTNIVHPNGYQGMKNYTMNYYCSTWKASWTEYVTMIDGTWSISTSGWSLAVGTETFQTRNPGDTTNDVTSDSITYPWTDSTLEWEHIDLVVDWWDVHIVAYTNRRDCTIDIIDEYESANTTKHNDVTEGIYDYTFEGEWGDHTVYVVATYGSTEISFEFTYKARRDYPQEPLSGGIPGELSAGVAFTALVVLIMGIGVAILVKDRYDKRSEFRMSLPDSETHRKKKKGKLMVERPHHEKLRSEHDATRRG